ncbi:MAG: GHKL domain-containing protein [Verrucomicrobia bacterium]|nr:GHKL domain-containing protein [Verrucomicrobiota bacterium]
MAPEHTLEDVRQYLQRVTRVERIVLPVKLAVILLAFSVLVLGIGQLAGPVSPTQQTFVRRIGSLRLQLGMYTIGNVIFWFFLFVLGRKIKHYAFVKTTGFLLVVIDMVFVSALIWLLPGPQQALFWLYCLVLVHAVLLFPDAVTMGVLTLISIGLYGAAALWQSTIIELPGSHVAESLDRESQRPITVLHFVILGLVGGGCYGGNFLIRNRLRALVEEQERVIREEKLNLAAIMATSIAHELKNPLAVMNNAAFILRRNEAQFEPKLRRQIEIIASEIQRSDKIIMDLLGYAKLAGGKILSISVNQILDEAIEDLQNEMAARKIVVTKAYERQLPPLLIDPAQLRTLVSNLLLNACEAIDSLGKITVATAYSDDGAIEMTIADTGKGIAEEELAKVFNSFYTTKEAGTGLGLSIVESIAKAYGGTVAVESRPGVGTQFTVRLPTRTVRERQ